jgi:hypothetical protein
MGERTNGVTDRSASKSADQLEQQVGLLREHLTDVVSELDYRRHELMDVKGQLKKRAPLIAMIAAGALVMVGGAVAASMWRKRLPPKKRAKTRVVTLEGKPYESVWHRIATAGAGALAAVAARALAQHLITPAIEGGRAPAGDLPPLPAD